MIMSGIASLAKTAGDPVRFITEVVRESTRLLIFHIAEPGNALNPNEDRLFSTITATVSQTVADRETVRTLRKANECYDIYYNGNLGGLYSFYVVVSGRPIEDLHALLNRAPIAPSIRVQGPGYVYGYWMAERPYTLSEWQRVQTSLAMHFRTGHQLCDPSLAIPLPGFDELCIERDGTISRTPIDCVVFEPYRLYSNGHMRSAFNRR